MSSESQLVSVNEAAEMLGLSPWTIRLWVTQRKIASHKVGARRLFARVEIERIIRESEQPRNSEVAA